MDVSKLVRKNIKDLNSYDSLEMNFIESKKFIFLMQMKIHGEKQIDIQILNIIV